MPPQPASSDAEIRFFKRQRLARVGVLAGALVGLGSTPVAQARWPALATWTVWLWAAGSVLICAALIWSWRCTLCDGGIKLNGRTCSRCGHEFSQARRSAPG